MTKRPSDEALRRKMNDYAGALLDAHYGHLLDVKDEEIVETLPSGAVAAILPKADIFNAVVNWLRTDSGMEPISQEKSGIATLIDQRNAARKQR